MWRQLWVVTRKEFWALRRDRGHIILLILAPILQLIIFGYAATQEVRNVEIAVLDHDGSALTRELMQKLQASGYFLTPRIAADEEEIFRLLDGGKVQVGLTIERDFTEKVQGGRTGHVQIFVDGSDSNAAAIILGYLNNITQDFAASQLALNLQGPLVDDASGPPIRALLVETRPRVWYNPELKSVNFMVPGIIGAILLTLIGDLTALSFVKEREQGTLEQLVVTPLSGFALLLGKTIPFLLIGMLNVLIIVIAGWFWFGVWFKGDALLLVGLSSLFVLTSLGVGVVVSSLARTQQAAMVTSAFYQLPSILLSGFIFPIENMPEPVQYVTYLIPYRYFLNIIRGIYLKGVGLEFLWQDAAILAGFGLVALLLSGFTFRRVLGRGLG